MRNPTKTHQNTAAPAATGPTAGSANSFARMHVNPAGDPGSSLTLRFARPDDRGALAELAALDSSRPPAGPVLLAEVAGELQAALSLSEHTIIANPFRPTAWLCDLLRARAEQLETAHRAPRFRLGSWLRPRLSPAIS